MPRATLAHHALTCTDPVRSPRFGVAALGLAALTPWYRLAIAARNGAFNLHLRRPRRLERPVISVGNLTTGGTGKTPMVIELVGRLKARGLCPAVLLRGYKAANGPGDEAQLLRDEANVPVGANPDRFAMARALLADHPETGVFVLDDGFQHRQMHRDVNLVLLDATNPFGGGHLLPWGRLREPASQLRRADAVIVTRSNEPSPVRDLDQKVLHLTGRLPLAHTEHRWSGYRRDDYADRPLPLETLARSTVVGICGIGNPASFQRAVHQAVGRLLRMHVLADHHPYDRALLERIVAQAQATGAEALLTTEKDWVKWRRWLPPRPALPIYRPVLRIGFADGSEPLDNLLDEIQRRAPQGGQPPSDRGR